MYRYTGAGIGPDVSTTLNARSTSGGGYDYNSLISGLMGKGGLTGQPKPQGGAPVGSAAYYGGGGPELGGSLYNAYNQSVGAMNPASGYGAAGNMAISGLNNRVSMDKFLPYMMQQQQSQQQSADTMALARLNGGIGLAGRAMDIEAQRQLQLQQEADNERNRQLQLEMQRRNSLQDQYSQARQYQYQYGLGEYK